MRWRGFLLTGCNTSKADFAHTAPYNQAFRGYCICYSGQFICQRPAPGISFFFDTNQRTLEKIFIISKSKWNVLINISFKSRNTVHVAKIMLSLLFFILQYSVQIFCYIESHALFYAWLCCSFRNSKTTSFEKHGF